MFYLSNRSKRNMAGVHPLLISLALKAITYSKVDFGVIEGGGLRTAKYQNYCYKKKRSKLDGYKKKSYHQSGLALDLVYYNRETHLYSWKEKLAYIEIMIAVSKVYLEMKKSGEFPEDLHLHWGGAWRWVDFNNNNIIDLPEEVGWDAPHFEIRSTPQHEMKWLEIL